MLSQQNVRTGRVKDLIKHNLVTSLTYLVWLKIALAEA